MINANELRIGNYILRNDIPGNWYELRALCKDRVHPIQVIEQDWAKNCFWASDCTLSELEPIPLEEDYLIKFDFAFDGEYYRPPVPNDKFKFLVYEGDTMDEYRLLLSGRQYISIYYVHQLQNLYFAITGQELIYKPQQ